MMLKNAILGTVMSIVLLGSVQAAQAITLDSGLSEAGSAATYDVNASPQATIGLAIKAVIAFLGVVFLVLTIYAGLTWMTAAGDEKKIAKAKGILVSSVIGLIIVLAAYTITTFVLGNIEFATQGGIGPV